MPKTDEDFKAAINGQKIPILVLDNKWHQLMEKMPADKRNVELETELNELLKKQGKAGTELKQYKQLKKKLMDEIVSYADDALNSKSRDVGKNLEKNKKYIDDCNEKIAEYEDLLLELPREIDRVNRELMLSTMSISYETLRTNESLIEEIGKWIAQIRVELKKKLIRKQEKELTNRAIYAFMHNVFGPDVIDLFDLKYLEQNEMDGEEKKEEKK